MVRRLLQLNSTQINCFDYSISSTFRIMRQWFGVSAKAALKMRRNQFINHANYKIIDSNVMDWANVSKIHTPPAAKQVFLLDEQRQFRDWEWGAIESHYWHRTA